MGQVGKSPRRLPPGRTRWRPALLVPLAFLLAGCGGGRGTVSGEVTFNGKPIPWGRITFLGQEENKTALSSPIIEGKYTIKDFPAGPVRIGVESFKAKAIDVKKIPPMMLERAREGGMAEPPPQVVGKFVEIPLKYANPDQSGLDYVVERGEQTHNVPLKPG